jgi:hypothetical protein
MESHGIPWNLMKSHRRFWNPMEGSGIPWKVLESHGRFWNSMEGSGTWRDLLLADK